MRHIITDSKEEIRLRERVRQLEKDAEMDQREKIELHHVPSTPRALIEALCNAERFVGFLVQCKAEGHDVADALEHARATSVAVRRAMGWA